MAVHIGLRLLDLSYVCFDSYLQMEICGLWELDSRVSARPKGPDRWSVSRISYAVARVRTRVAQLVRAAEPVHPMCSVANNQFLN